MIIIDNITTIFSKLYMYISNRNSIANYKDFNYIINNTYSIIKHNCSIRKYNFLIYLLRIAIYKVKNVTDIIYILKKITFHFKEISYEVSTDDICLVLITCLNKYPLNEIELQKFSILQQQYENDVGIQSYASTLFWICCIQSITERQRENIFIS